MPELQCPCWLPYGMIKGFDCDKVDSVFDHLENRSEALTE